MLKTPQCLIYLRASTKDQDAERCLSGLIDFASQNSLEHKIFKENISGTKLNRPELDRLLTVANDGDVLLVESVDRLSRLQAKDFEKLKAKINLKGLRLVVHDLPTTHISLNQVDSISASLLLPINNLLIDLLATVARLDNEKRIERIKQGQERAGYKASGRKPNIAKHNQIKKYLENGNLKCIEIAKLCEVGVATVYRVAAAVEKLAN
jgi:DNA invertase Pin-like site-specific DNA recombinase